MMPSIPEPLQSRPAFGGRPNVCTAATAVANRLAAHVVARVVARVVPLVTALVTALVVLTTVAEPLSAQRVHGTVRQAGGAIPVPGALVVARDSLGHERARTEADGLGAFDLALPAPGSYRVSALRIGFRLAGEGIVTVARGQTIPLDLQVGAAIAALAPVQVRGRSSCSGDRDAAALAADYWERARVALASVDPLTATDQARATVVTFDEVVDAATDSAQSVFASTQSGETRRPFGSEAPDSIAVTGFVRNVGRSVEYYAPDAEVLLSSPFASSHCFQSEPAPPGHDDWVGVYIAPQHSRDLADVTGDLWLDAETSQLRALEFTYTNVPDVARRAGAGGRVNFAYLPSGRAIVSRWWIRMPQVWIERTLDGVGVYQRVIDHERVSSVRVTGGEVASIEERGDTVYRSPGHAVIATVLRNGTPAGRASVEFLGTAHVVRADDAGRAVLSGILPGTYRARVALADDAASGQAQPDLTVFSRGDRDTTVLRFDAVHVAPPTPVKGSGTIAGRVLRARDSLPLGDALVTVAGTTLSARTGRNGEYRIPGVPAGEHAIRVARIGYYPFVIPEAVPPDSATSTNVAMHDLPGWLNAVVIKGERRDIPPYLEDVYRRGMSGFGSFFTREDLEREKSYDIKSLVTTIPGVYANDRGITFTRCSNDFGVGADKVQVYIDGTKATRYLRGTDTSSAGNPSSAAEDPFSVAAALKLVNIREVQAVEVYRGVAEIPAEFLNDACAVIAIWTRRY